MAKLANAEDLKSFAFGPVGSSPTTRTKETMEDYTLCKENDCWCKATIVNSTYVQLPYSIIDDVVENGFTNAQTLDFIAKAFEQV